MGPSAPIPDRVGSLLPAFAVAGSGADEGVRDLVEQHLFHSFFIRYLTQVSGERDALAPMVALTKPGLCPIEAERPRRAQTVGGKELPSGGKNPMVSDHGVRLAGRWFDRWSYTQARGFCASAGSRQIVIKPYTIEVCFFVVSCLHIAVGSRAPRIVAG